MARLTDCLLLASKGDVGDPIGDTIVIVDVVTHSDGYHETLYIRW